MDEKKSSLLLFLSVVLGTITIWLLDYYNAFY